VASWRFAPRSAESSGARLPANFSPSPALPVERGAGRVRVPSAWIGVLSAGLGRPLCASAHPRTRGSCRTILSIDKRQAWRPAATSRWPAPGVCRGPAAARGDARGLRARLPGSPGSRQSSWCNVLWFAANPVIVTQGSGAKEKCGLSPASGAAAAHILLHPSKRAGAWRRSPSTLILLAECWRSPDGTLTA
jgi:hypothetical protein